MKKTLILKDSITKNVDGWRLNQRMKSVVSVRSISGATTKAMKHHVMGCLEDESPATLLKKSLWHRCFPMNFAKFLRTPFFTEHLWWLLLS